MAKPKRKSKWEPEPAAPAAPKRGQSRIGRLLFNTRVLGVLLLTFGLYMAYLEKAKITRTGHGGGKSAAVPFIVCMGLAFAVDPETRRPAIAVTMLTLGFLGGVAWFFLWG